MREQVVTISFFYALGAFGCALSMVRRLRGAWTVGVFSGFVMALLLWPIFAADLIDMDRKDHID